MSKGSNTQTTQTNSSVAPNPQAMAAYSSLLSRAGQVSQTPYAGYTGQEVAPTNAEQLMGVGNVNMGAMGFAPYAGQAGSYISAAGTPTSASDISQYMDPYTSSVINATQADFDTQNQRAQSAVTGNAASQGALGGNRVGVAQALTQEGQERVQAPQIAQLRSAGFQNAVTNANAQKARELQSGQALSGANLANAQAQFAYGTQEQQTTQAQNTQQMTDYYQQQGYPFATAQWLAGITLGTGAQMGQTSAGTSTTQGPQPNQIAQGVGAGLGMLAMFSDKRLKENIKEIGKLHDGQKIYRYNFKGDPTTQVGLISDEVIKKHPEAVGKYAGFDTVDYDEATRDAIKKWSGGAVAGFAAGGTPYGVAGQGWVPTIGSIGGHTLTDPGVKPPNMGQQAQPDYSKMGAAAGKIGKGIYDNWPSSGGGYDWGSNPTGGMDVEYGGGGAYDRGGRIPISAGFAGGGHVYGYADRGRVVDDDIPIDATDIGPINVGGTWDRGADDISRRLVAPEDTTVAGNVGVLPTSYGNAPSTDSFTPALDAAAAEGNKIKTSGVHPLSDVGGGGRGFRNSEELPPDATAFDSSGVGPARITIGGAGNQPTYVPGVSAATPKPGMGGFNPFGLSDEARQGLISMGLGMMSNRVGGKGSFLSSVGQGGEQGMTTYASAKAATAAAQALARKEAFEREKFNAEYSRMKPADQVRLQELQNQHEWERKKFMLDMMEKQRAHDLARGRPVEIGTDENGFRQYVMPKPQKDGTIEYYPINKDGTLSPSPLGGSLKEGAARAEQKQQQPDSGQVVKAGFNPDEGTIPASNKMAEAGNYDYTKPIPFSIDKGMRVPDPAPTSNKSTKNIQADAEYFLETGKLPPQARGFNPGAIQMNRYRDAVQNYASAISDSRGLSPEDMATMRRNSPETYRFIRSAAGNTVISLGTAVRHLDTLRELQKAWNSGDIQMLNSVKAAFARQFGDASVTSLDAAANIVGAEVIKAIIGSQSGQAERDEARKLFTPLLSGRQALGNIDTVQKLLGGQLDGKERQAKALGVNEKQFKELIGDRPYEILKSASASETKKEGTSGTERRVVQTGTVNSGKNAGKTAYKYSDGTIEYK